MPDAILRCTIQTGDNSSADFLDGLVGSYRGGRFLRILMQNDEEDDPRGYWHSWDVPWSDLVQVILRRRTTPLVHTDVLQPDGTYARRGPYLQTRLYKVGRGMECRLLDRDQSLSSAPFDWLRANIADPEVRFARDTQEEPLYGDTIGTTDRLDEYTHGLKARSEVAEDKAQSERALALSGPELEKLRKASPQRIRDYLASPDFASDFTRHFAPLRGEDGAPPPSRVIEYCRRVVELVLLEAVRRRRYAIFFYDNFPESGRGLGGRARGELANAVRSMLMKFNLSFS